MVAVTKQNRPVLRHNFVRNECPLCSCVSVYCITVLRIPTRICRILFVSSILKWESEYTSLTSRSRTTFYIYDSCLRTSSIINNCLEYTFVTVYRIRISGLCCVSGDIILSGCGIVSISNDYICSLCIRLCTSFINCSSCNIIQDLSCICVIVISSSYSYTIIIKCVACSARSIICNTRRSSGCPCSTVYSKLRILDCCTRSFTVNSCTSISCRSNCGRTICGRVGILIFTLVYGNSCK